MVCEAPTTKRLMVIAIGLLLLLVNSYWVFMASEVWHSTQLTIASLFFNAVFTLFVLVLINLALQRFLKRFALSQADLLMIYVMVVMLTTISGHTMMGYLLPAVEHPFWFATAENGRNSSDTIFPHGWLCMTAMFWRGILRETHLSTWQNI